MYGRYEHAVDAKGRLFVPAKLRAELGSAFYVTLGGHVLPGFDENEYSEPFKRHVISESSLCGLTVEDLLRKLKK